MVTFEHAIAVWVTPIDKFLNSHDTITIYNPGHDILEPYNILIQIRFNTSEKKLDI